MWYVHQNEVIACVAILIATMILRSSRSTLKSAFVILIFGTGILAAMASFADIAAEAAVSSLFG